MWTWCSCAAGPAPGSACGRRAAGRLPVRGDAETGRHRGQLVSTGIDRRLRSRTTAGTGRPRRARRHGPRWAPTLARHSPQPSRCACARAWAPGLSSSSTRRRSRRGTGAPAPSPGSSREPARTGHPATSTPLPSSRPPGRSVAPLQRGAQRGPSPVDPASHGTQFHPQGRTDLLVRQSLDVAEHDRGPELGRRSSSAACRTGSRWVSENTCSGSGPPPADGPSPRAGPPSATARGGGPCRGRGSW